MSALSISAAGSVTATLAPDHSFETPTRTISSPAEVLAVITQRHQTRALAASPWIFGAADDHRDPRLHVNMARRVPVLMTRIRLEELGESAWYDTRYCRPTAR